MNEGSALCAKETCSDRSFNTGSWLEQCCFEQVICILESSVMKLSELFK